MPLGIYEHFGRPNTRPNCPATVRRIEVYWRKKTTKYSWLQFVLKAAFSFPVLSNIIEQQFINGELLIEKTSASSSHDNQLLS